MIKLSILLLFQGRSIASPRMYYNEWLPVGRGDPLKDPTYDYSPPVLDRVRYWAPEAVKDKSNEVLLLGVTAKKPITKMPKYQSIRRNFYTSLPSVLMPPPMIDDEHFEASSSMWTNPKLKYDEINNNHISRPNMIPHGTNSMSGMYYTQCKF